ncbi:succinate--hydroxymethylglutarate CoA-transferase-like [Tropilaelaps mercedesae]|uniref:Succinate--hydroxymethylglutarate CoA-transferase-like n=1 Tax=Tropilaelaps mercedesae TaxID=418985 RepID=A0A1V9XZ17_9ACAR|nr:succinate--hydroxymethylglutarate CoA-transferase-like [Tropilaelaps mercedesae]
MLRLRSYILESVTPSVSVRGLCSPVDPLDGVRVLDMSRILAGPFCAMLLGDLGADVVKVERPGEGDETRNWGPPFAHGASCYFLSANRNKKSVALDFKSDRGKDIIKRLAASSDVLIENFLPGKLDQLGIGYSDLNKVNSKLIYVSVTGYGTDGKYRDRAGYDVIAASMGGLLHITGPADGDPCKVGIAMTDLATGLYAKGAILTALLQRAKTGRGQKIECDLLASQVSLLVNIGSNYLNAGIDGNRWGTSHASIVPYKAYRTKDGYITVGGGSEKQFQVLCHRLGLDRLISDERFVSNALRVAHRRELDSIIQDRFAEKTNKQWLELLEGCGIPYGPINSIKDVFEDKAIAERMVVHTRHPCGDDIKVVGPAVRFTDSINKVRKAPPHLGEHTLEILSEFYSKKELDDLVAAKIIQAKQL